jgi:vacuolar protein sorting-associated protein 8
LRLFQEAGFFRILRSWYSHERQWPQLLLTYFQDADLRSSELFENIEEVLANILRLNKKCLPEDVLHTLMAAISNLVDTSIPRTAFLIERYAPHKHADVLGLIEMQAEHKRFAYLRSLLGPLRPNEDDDLEGVTIPDLLSPHISLSSYQSARVIFQILYSVIGLISWSN